MTDTSCTDDARVKVSSLQKKITLFLQYKIFHRDVIQIYIFVCLKMLLTAVIKDEHAPNVLLHSDSSFLLRYNMETNTTISLITEI